LLRLSRRLAPLALAAMPAAALAALSTEEVVAEAAKLPRVTPGLYRMTLEMLEIDAPSASKEEAKGLRLVMGKNGEEAKESCVTPEDAAIAPGDELVREILADRCTFDHLRVSGETISAIVQCPAGDDLPSRVKMSGRVGAEGMQLMLTVEQKPAGQEPIRISMRVSTERLGDCP
jgi:hypothetical protein